MLTALFLPLTLITGLFGMNVTGLPFGAEGGGFVDGAFDPMTYAHFPGRHELLTARTPVSFLDFEDRHMDEVQEIERSSLDYYASVRSLYRQRREAQVQGVEFSNMNLPDL